MIYLSFYASLCVAFVGMTSTSSLDPIQPPTFLSPENDGCLSMGRRSNLNQILDYVHGSQEFCPLILSIISTQSQIGMVEFLAKYAAKNSINLYKVRARDLSQKNLWKWRTDLTWVLPVSDFRELEGLIYWQQDLWKPTNQYLILFMNETEVISWRQIFEILWQRYNVYRVIVASIGDDFQCLMKYLPFDLSHEKFGGLHRVCFENSSVSSTRPVSTNRARGNDSLDEINTVSLVRNNDKLFETFQDLKNYPLNVVVFPSLMMNISYDETGKATFSLLDADMTQLLERSLKAQFRVNVLMKSDSVDPFHRALQLIESGQAEMVLTGFFMKTYDEYHKFEFTSAVYEDRLCFIAPSSGLVPKSYMLFKPFQPQVWVILLFYNIIVTILWFLVGNASKSLQKKQSISLLSTPNSIRKRNSSQSTSSSTQEFEVSLNELRSPWFDSYIPGFASPVFIMATSRKNRVVRVYKPPEINPHVISCFDLVETACYPLQGARTSAQKAFLFGTLFFGLIVTGVYQSSLVSSLSKPFHYPEINTLENVLDSNMTIVTKYWNLKASLLDDSLIGSILKDRIEVITSKLPTNHMVAFTKKMIALGRYASVKLENLTAYYDEEGNKLLHIVDECPASYMLSYAVRQYSPYRERITMILLRMQEAGLINLWYKNMTYSLDVEEKKKEDAQNERRIKLTLEHYALTFLGLFIGLLCCTAVFLGELYVAGRLSCQFASRKSRR